MQIQLDHHGLLFLHLVLLHPLRRLPKYLQFPLFPFLLLLHDLSPHSSQILQLLLLPMLVSGEVGLILHL